MTMIVESSSFAGEKKGTRKKKMMSGKVHGDEGADE